MTNIHKESKKYTEQLRREFLAAHGNGLYSSKTAQNDTVPTGNPKTKRRKNLLKTIINGIGSLFGMR